MLKKDIKYTDLDGKSVTETHYFHLNKADLAELELSFEGGLEGTLRRIIETKNGREIMDLFKTILKQAYGTRGQDGRRFIKSEEIWNNFAETDAYSELFFEMVTNADAMATFIKGVVPADMATQVEQRLSSGQFELPEPATENVFSKSEPEPEPIETDNDTDPWIVEKRLPTQTELATMTPAQISKAYRPGRVPQDA